MLLNVCSKFMLCENANVMHLTSYLCGMY